MNAASQVLFRKRTYRRNPKTGNLSWGPWQDLLARSPNPQPHVFCFPLGGTLKIYPNSVTPEMQQQVTEELKSHPTYFREYTIQGGREPRAHFLLHEKAPPNAVDDPTIPTPGYKYGTIKMKSRPLSELPCLQGLSQSIQGMCGGVEEWNIGVDAVYYRCGRDKMGNHADDDQGESLIVTALVSSPTTPRQVIFQKKKPKGELRQEGEEQWELSLGAGDVYSMDDVMQQNYVHGVPEIKKKKKTTKSKHEERIAIVFRVGTYTEYAKDSGCAVENLEPRPPPPRVIGQMDCLEEGATYPRGLLLDTGAHHSPQRGISGNKDDGCDAIIVSSARKDDSGWDGFGDLIYCAESRVGAGGILTSLQRGDPIRVFRSSSPDNKYPALRLDSGSNGYRYDGLYHLESVTYRVGEYVIYETADNVSPVDTQRLYAFHLRRIQVGDSNFSNRKSTQELLAGLPYVVSPDEVPVGVTWPAGNTRARKRKAPDDVLVSATRPTRNTRSTKRKIVTPDQAPTVEWTNRTMSAERDTITESRVTVSIKGPKATSKHSRVTSKATNPVLSNVPDDIKSLWGQSGVARWGKRWLPALVISPVDSTVSAEAREEWMQKARQAKDRKMPMRHLLVFWYGTENHNRNFSIVSAGSFKVTQEASRNAEIVT